MLPDPLSHYRQKLRAFVHACGECIDDLKLHREGIPVFYNLDFSLLCPVLFSTAKAPPGSKEFLISERDGMTRVVEKAPTEGGFGLVISGATLIEFYDQLDHTFRHIRDVVPSLRRQLAAKELADEVILRKAIATSSEIKRDLALFTQSGIDARLRAPINRLMNFLDANKIRGIGDVLDHELIRDATKANLYQQFLDQQNASRHDTRLSYTRKLVTA